MKQCITCGHKKIKTEFYRQSSKTLKLRTECKLCNNKRRRIWAKNNLLKERSFHYKNRYGLSLKDYNLLSKAQRHKCGICSSKQGEHKRSLSVDHDHNTGKIRGLLCLHCNTALGGFKDNIDLLDKAKDYLQRSLDATK